MPTRELQTAKEVVDALGGPAATGRLTGRSTQAAWNWKRDGRLPADFYLLINDALKGDGKCAPPELFGIVPAPDKEAAE